MYKCTHMTTHAFACMYMYAACVCSCVHMHVCMCAHACVRMHAHAREHAHAHMHEMFQNNRLVYIFFSSLDINIKFGMALLGIQFVISLVVALIIQKLSPFYSLARWIMCSGLYRYLHPTNEKLRTLAGKPNITTKGLKNLKILCFFVYL